MASRGVKRSLYNDHESSENHINPDSGTSPFDSYAGQHNGLTKDDRNNNTCRWSEQRSRKGLQSCDGMQKKDDEEDEETKTKIMQNLRLSVRKGQLESNQNLDMDIEYLDCFEEPSLVDYRISTASDTDTDRNNNANISSFEKPFYNRKVDYVLNLNDRSVEKQEAGRHPGSQHDVPKPSKQTLNPLSLLSASLSRKSKSSHIYQKNKPKQKVAPEVVENNPPLSRKSILRSSVDSIGSVETCIVNSDSSRSCSKRVHFSDQKKRRIQPSVELVELVRSDSDTSLDSRSSLSFVSLSEQSLSSGTGSLNLVDYSLSSVSNDPDRFMDDTMDATNQSPEIEMNVNQTYEYNKDDLVLNLASPFTRLSRQYSSNDSDYSTENESLYGLEKSKSKAQHSSDESNSTHTSAYSSSSSLKSKSISSPFAYSKTKITTHSTVSSGSSSDEDHEIATDNTLSKLEVKELNKPSGDSEDDVYSSNSNSTLAESSSSDHEPEYITSPSGVKIMKESFTSGSEFESSGESDTGSRTNPTWLLTVKEHRASSPIYEDPNCDSEQEKLDTNLYEKEINFTLKTHTRVKCFQESGCQSENIEVNDGDNSADDTSHNVSSNLTEINDAVSTDFLRVTHSPDTSIDVGKECIDIPGKYVSSQTGGKKTKDSSSQYDSPPQEKWNTLKISTRKPQDRPVKRGKVYSSSSDEYESMNKCHVKSERSNGKDGSPGNRKTSSGSKNSSLERKNVSLEHNNTKNSSSGINHTSSGSDKCSPEKNNPTDEQQVYSTSSKDVEEKIASCSSSSSSLSENKSSELGSHMEIPTDESITKNTNESSSMDISSSASDIDNYDQIIDNQNIFTQSSTGSATHSSFIIQSRTDDQNSTAQATAGSTPNSKLEISLQVRTEMTITAETMEDEHPEFKGYLDINSMNKDIKPVELNKECPTANIPRLSALSSTNTSHSQTSSLIMGKKPALRRRKKNNDNKAVEATFHKEVRDRDMKHSKNKTNEDNVQSDEENTSAGIVNIEDEKDLVYRIRLFNVSVMDNGVEGDTEDDDCSVKDSVEDDEISYSDVVESTITAIKDDKDDQGKKKSKWEDDYGILEAMKWIMCPCMDA